ncbi:hypothetical protein OS188_13220 [Xanthomarina sp. F1114]|uniref:hypothetical protein n=1 Tax=Xanthomarina sp. F1114 TaxID=2996019 RepID=UPI00225E0B0C|nr:hypothetical protein [Xanthomarina sp. F1114]MCX7548912.1 hypothetical protein [Xanthomarina sp. F1114]
MKILAIFISIISFFSLTQNLSEIRLAYKEATQDKENMLLFYNMLKDVNKENNVNLVAYKGAAIALKAKYAVTLKEKKDGFIDGVSYIEFAIEKEPNAIEPRFIRLGIQENTPKILKYKDNIDQDKLFLLKQYQHISSENLKNHIRDYILQSKVFTDEEKLTITNQ